MSDPDLILQVADVADVATDVRAYRLVAAGGGELPVFEAGAHISLHLPSGLLRDYSLCSDPADSSAWRIAVKREKDGRGGSHEVHCWLTRGARLTVSGPRNHFRLPEGDRPVLLLAAGIGITPILSMVHELRATQRRFRLVYLARDAAHAPFADELVPVADEDMSLHLRDQASARCDLRALLTGLGPHWAVQCCGPLPLIDEVEWLAKTLAWPPERLRREIFRAAEPVMTDADRPLQVRLASTGQVIPIAAGQTILTALLDAGIDVAFSCEEGTCGTCITRILEGEPDHRDSVLMPHEKADHIAVCCSRAKSDMLTLDL